METEVQQLHDALTRELALLTDDELRDLSRKFVAAVAIELQKRAQAEKTWH